ncbi:nose resistant to fluoxetine protein 6-like [Aricia agestis]|uniref:nose resistant to fluoxetine protein 6-like n=1 Tax=Aricia agestis TaxID=91739 RepID=UPI001C2019FC|nr:nose resistant to fluoxetine protein 6-like [Aricia agestis]
MPRLFSLEEQPGCLATAGVYCLGSFELTAPHHNPLYRRLQEYSSDWVQHFNHTRLHRGVCLSRSCPPAPPAPLTPHAIHAWFASCVNASTMAEYNLSARLYHVDYCSQGEAPAAPPGSQGLAVVVALILILATVSTVLDLTLAEDTKKGQGWALSWSVPRSWRSLTAPQGSETDLHFLDGLRFFCMLCIIIEHVGWLATLSYISDTKFYEQKRRSGDVLLLTNSTLVVQVFFIMSSYLMARKVLQEDQPPVTTFFKTMLNRFIRLSPSYFLVIWFAASWWELGGSGPLWQPLVASEAAVCRRTWWMYPLYINNFNFGDKCLIQTWYLAADMQLYAAGLLLTLLLRGRRAVPVLLALLGVSALVPFAIAYTYNLMPTYVLHRPEAVRVQYSGDASFNWLYQSPLGNAVAMLTGLLIAHGQHAMRGSHIDLARNKIFSWVSVVAIPMIVVWAALSPRLLAPGPPPRLGAALLAAFERPVFGALAALGMFGAIQGVDSAIRRVLSGGAVLARLSFGALLLHVPINKAMLGASLRPAQIDRFQFFVEFFGVSAMSYTLAVPLALLVELPAQRLYRELTTRPKAPTAEKEAVK